MVDWTQAIKDLKTKNQLSRENHRLALERLRSLLEPIAKELITTIHIHANCFSPNFMVNLSDGVKVITLSAAINLHEFKERFIKDTTATLDNYLSVDYAWIQAFSTLLEQGEPIELSGVMLVVRSKCKMLPEVLTDL